MMASDDHDIYRAGGLTPNAELRGRRSLRASPRVELKRATPAQFGIEASDEGNVETRRRPGFHFSLPSQRSANSPSVPIAGWAPVTRSATSSAEPQACVQPMAPWPLLR